MIGALAALIGLAGAGTAFSAPSTSPELVPFTGTRTISATWGAPSDDYHSASSPAIDVSMPIGTPIYAAGAGQVIQADIDPRNCNPNDHGGLTAGVKWCSDHGYHGTRLRIRHPDGRISQYLHLNNIVVPNGAQVAAGQHVAYSGNSGASTGAHLHYAEQNSGGANVDPGDWSACFGSEVVLHINLQARKWHAIRNDGYGCHPVTPPVDPPAPDRDRDGTPDSNDRCVDRPGKQPLQGCPLSDFDVSHSSDFNGDGRADIAAFYDYGEGSRGLFVHRGTPGGLEATATKLHQSPVGSWQMDRTRMVAGDFNGDGRADIAAFYDYGEGSRGLFVHRGTPNGLETTATKLHQSPVGSWQMDRTRLVAGDFNGDGRADVAAFYDYGQDSRGLFVHRGTPSGLEPTATRLHQSPVGSWQMDRTRLIGGDFDGDGRTDIAAFYDYGQGSRAIFIHRGTAGGLSTEANLIGRTENGQWQMPNTRLAAGDFNGDGRDDIAAYYDYGHASRGIWIHHGTSTGLNPQAVLIDRAPNGTWITDLTRLAPGDFNGDRRADLAAFYDYGHGSRGIFMHTGAASGLTPRASKLTQSELGAWVMDRTILVSGAAIRPAPAPVPPASGAAPPAAHQPAPAVPALTPTQPATTSPAPNAEATAPGRLTAARIRTATAAVRGARITVALRAKVGRAFAGRRVLVQRKVGSRWRALTATKVQRNGTIRAKVVLNRRASGLRGARGVKAITLRFALPKTAAKTGRIGPARTIKLRV